MHPSKISTGLIHRAITHIEYASAAKVYPCGAQIHGVVSYQSSCGSGDTDQRESSLPKSKGSASGDAIGEAFGVALGLGAGLGLGTGSIAAPRLADLERERATMFAVVICAEQDDAKTSNQLEQQNNQNTRHNKQNIY